MRDLLPWASFALWQGDFKKKQKKILSGATSVTISLLWKPGNRGGSSRICQKLYRFFPYASRFSRKRSQSCFCSSMLAQHNTYNNYKTPNTTRNITRSLCWSSSNKQMTRKLCSVWKVKLLKICYFNNFQRICSKNAALSSSGDPEGGGGGGKISLFFCSPN